MNGTSKVVLALVALAGVGVWLPGCGGNSDLACSLNIAGQKLCYAYSDLSADNAKTAKSACSSQSGTLVDSCPRDGLVGCCERNENGISYQSCSYSGTESANEAICSGSRGKWTSGSAGLGSSGGGGSGGSSSSSSTTNTPGCTTGDPGCACYPNKTCNGTLTCTSGICAYGSGGGGAGGGGGGGGSSMPPSTCGSGSGLCCPGNYCTVGTAKGYQFAYSDLSDGGGSSASLVGTDKMCVSGTAMGAMCDTQSCFSTHWGGGIGINLNQAQVDGSTPMNFTGAGSSGVTYSLDNYISGSMRIVVGDSTTDYCVNLNSGSGTIPWRSFNSACWNGTGTSLSGPPTNFTSIRFQVVADGLYGVNTSFNFCVLQLSL